ncbi:MFS transporter [Amycolatopsis sp. La24]|uniref:MFS transporter n=1 Tax=Amycolatopsis sp. La24 TaxID=3028304 RepID=UPI0023B16626|nr:MFS transporter [Amycolatopsis sp. La24]
MGRRHWTGAAAAVFVCGWGGNQFTPLLVLYREAGWSVAIVDALLSAYVVGLVPGLLVASRLSARFGHKRVMTAAVAVSLLSGLMTAAGGFASGSTMITWISVGRFSTGAAAAIAMAAGTTWVTELSSDPAAGTRRGALWLTLGFAAGPGVAGLLAQLLSTSSGHSAMVVPYLPHVVLAAVLLPMLPRLAETRIADGKPVARLTVARNPRFVRVILPMAPWIFGSAGIAYAIMPQVVGNSVRSWGLAYSTLLTVCTLGAGALVQPLAKRLDHHGSARAVAISMAVMSAGLAASAIAAGTGSPALALAAAITLGLAYGIAVVSGLLELQRLAAPGELATLTGVYYALAYSGFLLPTVLALLAGVASYPTLLSGLVLIALSGMLVILRHSRAHLPAPAAHRLPEAG